MRVVRIEEMGDKNFLSKLLSIFWNSRSAVDMQTRWKNQRVFDHNAYIALFVLFIPEKNFPNEEASSSQHKSSSQRQSQPQLQPQPQPQHLKNLNLNLQHQTEAIRSFQHQTEAIQSFQHQTEAIQSSQSSQAQANVPHQPIVNVDTEATPEPSDEASFVHFETPF